MHNAESQEAQRLRGVPAVGALESSQEVLPVACCVTYVRANPLSGGKSCRACHKGEPRRLVPNKVELREIKQ